MTTSSAAVRKVLLARGAVLALAVGLWFSPVPEGLVPQAWHLFALFVAAIVSVVIGAFPILTSSVLALAVAVLSGTLAPAKAYAGFANGTILLIVVAFLVARAVVKCGLGERLGHLVVSVFGRSTLGLGYSIFVVDGVIAPAFPSNTARSGVLYPLVLSVAEAAGARPGEEGKQAPRQLPDVLGHREPDGVVGALVHRHGRQPARGRDRPRLRPPDRLRLVARRLLDSDARRDGAAAARPLQGHRTRGDRDARGAARRAAGARGARAAPRAREDRGGHLRRHGGAVGGGRDPRARLDRGRVPRPRRPARDRRPHARRHREGRRRARDLHLVRGALHAQRAAQRARLHGLPGGAAGRGPRAACRRASPEWCSSSPTSCSTTCS